MQIANDKAVSFHYTLTDAKGQIIDSSLDSEALVYLHGYNNIISGLETALEGKKVGDKFNAVILPEDAYGVRNEAMMQVVDKAMFQDMGELKVGMQFHANVSHGTGVVTIVAIDGDKVTLDGNHPLAGETLNFAVEITDVRDATTEELAHGHIHGEGCHH